MTHLQIIDALIGLKAIPDNSIHCCITSPPYWGLRSYLPKDHPLKHLEIGSEKTPEEYVQKLVEVFREVRRTLREDGSLWLNLGDSFARNGGVAAGGNRAAMHMEGKQTRMCKIPSGSELKPKDLIGIPWMVAFALRADGWYLRSHCPWVKRNGMPESVNDRPSTTVESMFLLTKSPDYFYDPEAVRKIGEIRAGTRGAKGSAERAAVDGVNARPPEYKVYDGTRLRRSSDWFFESLHGLLGNEAGEPIAFVVNTKPYRGAHFATFPSDLIKPCVLASTSERGCCTSCGAPHLRLVEKTDIPDPSYKGSRFDSGKTVARDGGDRTQVGERFLKTTVGWEPSCDCQSGIKPCSVLDPFAGSGTVGEVCNSLGRDSFLLEFNPEYEPLIQTRISKTPLPATSRANSKVPAPSALVRTSGSRASDETPREPA